MAVQEAGADSEVIENASAPRLYQSVMQMHRGEAVWQLGFESNGNSAAGHGHGALVKTLTQKFRIHLIGI